MFTKLPEAFKKFDLSVDVRALLLLQKAMDRGLVKTIGDLYNVLRTFIIKDPEHIGPYTKAFYSYFLDINIRPNERLNDAILRSQTFEQWKEVNFGRIEEDITPEEWVNRFLDQVHLTHYDIKEVLDWKELWDKDKGDLADEQEQNQEETPNRPLDRMADYSDLSLEELMQRMEEVMKQQQSQHSGGSHW